MVKFKTRKSNQASLRCKLAHLKCSSAAISPVGLGGESLGRSSSNVSGVALVLRNRAICMHKHIWANEMLAHSSKVDDVASWQGL